MSKLPKDAILETGVLVIGSTSVSAAEIAKELTERYKAELYAYLNDREALNEETKAKFYDIYKLPEDQRKYLVIHVNQKGLTSSSELLEPLIGEKRPLRIIFVVEIENISELNESQQNLLFGNFGNFIIGNLSTQNKELLNSHTNNILSEGDINLNNQGPTTLLSYMIDNNYNRKTIKLF